MPLASSPLRVFLFLALSGVVQSAFGQPDNDSFARAIPLQGEHAQTDIFFLGATHEPEDPAILEGPTVWYTWTPPRDGWLRLYPYPLVYLFQGTEVGALAYQEPVTAWIGRFYRVTASQAYAIAVVSPGGNPDGTFSPLRFELDFATPPANDLFSNRIPLSGDTVEARGPTVGAVQQPGEPFAAVWWTWIAPASGLVTLELIDAAGDSVAAYIGTSLETLSLAGQIPHPQYPVTFAVQAGQPYQVAAVSGQNEPVAFRLALERLLFAQGLSENQVFRQGASLDVTFTGIVPGDVITNLNVYVNTLGTVLDTNALAPLSMPFLPPGTHTLTAWAKAANGRRYSLPPLRFYVQHPNDYFDARPVLSGDDVTFEANLRGAPPYPEVNLLWWKWTAPHSGVIHIEQIAGDALSWSLFKGATVATLQQVPDWSVQAGETYSLQASSLHGVGTYRFRILRTPPANDAFANARPLDGTELWEPIRLDTATPDPGEPGVDQAPNVPSIWFTFTPPNNGVVSFGGGISPTSMTPYLWPASVFSGSSLNALIPVGALDGGAQFPVTGGQLYALRLQKAFPGDGTYPYVYFLFTPSPPNDSIANATLLQGERATFTIGLHGATAVSDEPPSYVGYVPNRSIWYQWTPPYDGFAAVRFPGSSGSIAIGIEVFTNGPNLTPAPAMLLENEGLFFDAHAATTYYLRFSDFSGLWTNQYAAELSLTSLSFSSPQAGAGFMSPAGPEFAISAQGSLRSVSYREKTGEGSGGLWRWANWREVTNLTTAPFTFTETNLPVGFHTFYAVLTNSDGQVSYLPPVVFQIRPANDSFATRQLLTGRNVSTQGTTMSATIEPGEPAIGNPVADLSVWYTWVAPASAPTIVEVYGENYVRVFEGTALTDLVLVNPAAPLTRRFDFTSVAGKTYQIAVASVSTSPAYGHWTTFGLNIGMDLLQLLAPVTGSVYSTETTVPIAISTPELPDQVLSTSFIAARDRPPQQVTLLEAPGLVLNYSWADPGPGNYSILAKLTFTSAETVTRWASIRVYPTNVNFTNATVLAGDAGVFQPTFLGLTGSGPFPRGTVWYRFTAETNGYLLISSSNAIGAIIDFQASTGVSTNSLVAVPQSGNLRQSAWAAIFITNGTTYNLRFTGDIGTQLPPLQYQVVQPPANDLFANAELLSGDHFAMHTMTAFATNQPGEPPHFGTPAQRTLWWKWLAPAKGWVSITGRVKVYTGDSLTALTALPNASVASNTACMVVLDAGSSTALYSDWKLDFNRTPSNDDFVNRTQLTGRRVAFRADLSYATQEPGEDAVFPGGWNYGHTVWFTWVPPANGQALLRRVPGAAYARICLFRGAELGSLVYLDQDAYQPFTVQAGEDLHISVDFNGGGPAFTTLEVLLNEPPANDNFANPIALTETAPSAASWNFGASREYGEPNHNQQFGGRSVWFRWTAKVTGNAEVFLSGDIFTNILAVYEGAALNGLFPLAASTLPLTNYLAFPAVGGQTYDIAVDGAFGAVGDFTLRVQATGTSSTPVIESVKLINGSLVLFLRPGTVACTLQRCEDLTTWEDFTAVEPAQGQVDVPTDAAQAFFRLKQP